MADWTTLIDSAVGVGGIPSGSTVTALRDNPVAIAEGAVGAPRVVDAALDDGAATSDGVTWVRLRMAGAAVGAVGTYAFLGRSIPANTTIANPGDVELGSTLEYANDAGSSGWSNTSPSGSWRCMGHLENADDTNQSVATLFLRIS